MVGASGGRGGFGGRGGGRGGRGGVGDRGGRGGGRGGRTWFSPTVRPIPEYNLLQAAECSRAAGVVVVVGPAVAAAEASGAVVRGAD